MTATAAEVATLRRMTAEPSLDNYDDAALAAVIESLPLEVGYDLNRAAALIWDQKAAKEADSYDFSQGSAGNATYKRSQLFTQARAMARSYRARAPMRTAELVIDRDDEEALKSKWGGYPSLLLEPDPTHGGLYSGQFIEEEGDF